MGLVMNIADVREMFYENAAKIDQIYFVPSFESEREIPEGMHEFFVDSDIDDLVYALGISGEDEIQWLLNSIRNAEYVYEWLTLNNKNGFFVKFATPVMDRGTYSWGCYTTQWVYGDTFEEALDKGFAWVELMREKENASCA